MHVYRLASESDCCLLPSETIKGLIIKTLIVNNFLLCVHVGINMFLLSNTVKETTWVERMGNVFENMIVFETYSCNTHTYSNNNYNNIS